MPVDRPASIEELYALVDAGEIDIVESKEQDDGKLWVKLQDYRPLHQEAYGEVETYEVTM